MVQDKLIRVHKVGQNFPLYFLLPTSKAPTVFSHAHEKSCADIYVSYATTGLLTEWGVPEEFPDYEEYEKTGLRPDRISSIGGKIIFWEIDRGSENYDKVSEKVPRYIELGKRHPKHRFHVVFTTRDCHRHKNGKQILRQSSKARAKRILLDLIDFKRGSQFLVAEHQMITDTPLGKVFVSPIDPQTYISLCQLM